MMTCETTDVIPSPSVVRDRLAHALHQTRLLRRQLRLSLDAARDGRHRPDATRPQAREPRREAS